MSGTVTAVVRGERRKVLRVTIAADKENEYRAFGVKDVSAMNGDTVVSQLLDAGLFGYINQLPYAVSTVPTTRPKGIFVSALRDKPLAADFEYELIGNEKVSQIGLTALSKIAPTFLGIGTKQKAKALTEAKDVKINVFHGPCPAGNVGVQVNHLSPVNKGEVVWTVSPTVVIFIGRLLDTGRVDLRHRVALVGSEVLKPAYAEMTVGQELATLLSNSYDADHNVRIIDGILPKVLVSYIVGLGIEFAWAQWKGEEIQEGYLVSGIIIPLIVPVGCPLWALAVAVAFAVIFAKEIFGGTGMNIFNVSLVARAFLFFSYPTKMSGDGVWVSTESICGLGNTLPDGFTYATPLGQICQGVAVDHTLSDMILGLILGSIGETSVVAIAIGALILLWTGVASWKTMLSVFLGGGLTAAMFSALGLFLWCALTQRSFLS